MRYLFAFLFFFSSHTSWSQIPVPPNDLITTFDTASGRYGFKDTKGTWVIAPRFYEATDFQNGLANVWEHPNFYVDTGSDCGTPVYHPSWGYINSKGEYIIPSEHPIRGRWENGNIVIGNSQRKTVIYDREGKLLSK